jgi:hypothetical protein
MGRLYGFKLHLIISDKGEILNFVLTQANVDHTAPLKDCKFVAKLKGKLYNDKRYISKKLTELLFIDRLHLVTSSRNNLKNVLLELKDKILLRKRSVIETVNDELKQVSNATFKTQVIHKFHNKYHCRAHCIFISPKETKYQISTS